MCLSTIRVKNAPLGVRFYTDKFSRIRPNLIIGYDEVERIVEKERYVEYGVHKGAIGCVMDSNAVGEYIW